MSFKWRQDRAVHCPAPKCNGMLLQSDFCHEEVCSDCGKYWIKISRYVGTKKPVIPKQEEGKLK
ncbi:MAG TPA: hypothetical protein ENH95_02265 [Nitrosopumilus sp.]|nr:hypothetical protein [Nitrosopumilus sp.]